MFAIVSFCLFHIKSIEIVYLVDDGKLQMTMNKTRDKSVESQSKDIFWREFFHCVFHLVCWQFPDNVRLVFSCAFFEKQKMIIKIECATNETKEMKNRKKWERATFIGPFFIVADVVGEDNDGDDSWSPFTLRIIFHFVEVFYNFTKKASEKPDLASVCVCVCDTKRHRCCVNVQLNNAHSRPTVNSENCNSFVVHYNDNEHKKCRFFFHNLKLQWK